MHAVVPPVRTPRLGGQIDPLVQRHIHRRPPLSPRSRAPRQLPRYGSVESPAEVSVGGVVARVLQRVVLFQQQGRVQGGAYQGRVASIQVTCTIARIGDYVEKLRAEQDTRQNPPEEGREFDLCEEHAGKPRDTHEERHLGRNG